MPDNSYDINNLIAKCRIMEIDHEPDGWPGIRMREVSALCDEIDRLKKQLQKPTVERIV